MCKNKMNWNNEWENPVTRKIGFTAWSLNVWTNSSVVILDSPPKWFTTSMNWKIKKLSNDLFTMNCFIKGSQCCKSLPNHKNLQGWTLGIPVRAADPWSHGPGHEIFSTRLHFQVGAQSRKIQIHGKNSCHQDAPSWKMYKFHTVFLPCLCK